MKLMELYKTHMELLFFEIFSISNTINQDTYKHEPVRRVE